ncbi:MAG: DUF362 domain-containing protein [Nitrospirae bacterium]|nr:DUF362 domain-containing protein [Nitrospirota bacterium]
MLRVFIRRADYDYKTLKPVFFELMDSTAGDMIRKNSRVVIKPNLLAPAPPEKAIVTHPLIVKAAVEYVLYKNAKPVVSDSPAVGSFEKILKESGIRGVLEGLKVEFREFKTSVTVDAGEPFRKIDIAEDALTADFLINLPKLKTHAQMLLTLGIKNLFGCIVGLKKPEWHFRAGVDRDMFARLLVKVYQTVKPSVTIIDGVLAMQGEGPGKSGKPKHIGVLLGSRDTAALDIAVCKMLSIAPDRLLTNKFALEQGLTTEEITIDGELPEIREFKFPEITPLVFGPKRLHGLMRRHLLQRPQCDDPLCKLCGECWSYCPAEAIKRGNKRIHFDYEKCIRCYCCIEVCPHGALSAKETLPGKVTRRLLKM